MTRDQKRARVFGVLYLITFATSIPAAALSGKGDSRNGAFLSPHMSPHMSPEDTLDRRWRVGTGATPGSSSAWLR
jgi:hypothetical protein